MVSNAYGIRWQQRWRGEGRIDTGETSDEVRFEGVDGFFCWVGVMAVGWSKFMFDVVAF